MAAAKQQVQAGRPTAALVAGGCGLLAALSLLLPSVPSYDPWAWLVWGREIIALDLQTTSGPSWKPLPVLFTALYSLAGGWAPDLWLVTARAGTLGAAVAAFVLGSRLGGRVAGGLAAALLLCSPWLWGATWTGTSEGILILCLLGAVLRHLDDRHGQAFALAVATGLLRPEAWPFLGLYAFWLSVEDRQRLVWVAGGLALIPLLWLLPELWGSGVLFRAAQRAREVGLDSPGAAARPAFEVLEQAVTLAPLPVPLGILAWAVGAWRRRSQFDRVLPSLALFALAATWVLLVAVMAEVGFSGISRYLFAPVGISCVLAGLGLGWLVKDLIEAGPLRHVRVAGLAAVALLGVTGVALRAAGGSPTVEQLRHESGVFDELDHAIATAGGQHRLEACGNLYATFQTGPALAWKLGRHLREVPPGGPPPGTVLRATPILDDPVDPPAGAWATVPGRRTIANTRHWNIETTCRR